MGKTHDVSRPVFGRRTLAKAGAAAAVAWTLARPERALGANDRIRLGFIGVGRQGMHLLNSFLLHSDLEITALSDVSGAALEAARSRVGDKVATCGDFRRLLDRKDVDAVVIATPDHWHAIQTIMACRAGKDVYVEKPLSITVREGRRMVEVARQTRRVVQVGIHRRSCQAYAEMADFVRAGKLGKITVSRCYDVRNMYPEGIGKAPPGDPPKDLDWDLWLGPRPLRPYQATIAPFKFRWWDLYSSQVANMGVHFLDATRWIIGELAPASVCAMGGRIAIDDDRTIPDTLEVTYQCASGRLIVFGQYEASGCPVLPEKCYVEIRGTSGTAYLSEDRVTLVPELVAKYQPHPPKLERTEIATPEEQKKGKQGVRLSLSARHVGNFLDCVRSRATPHCDLETGHRSTTFSLLANISLATRLRLEWDAQHETITNSAEANSLLHYEYRKPWSLE